MKLFRGLYFSELRMRGLKLGEDLEEDLEDWDDKDLEGLKELEDED